MKEVLNVILDIITQKEVYGTFIIIFLCYTIFKIINHVVDKMFNKGDKQFEIKKRNTIIRVMRNATKYTLTTVGIIALLALYGVNVKAMVAGLGIAGTILGLALQDTFKDIISGINIIN